MLLAALWPAGGELSDMDRALLSGALATAILLVALLLSSGSTGPALHLKRLPGPKGLPLLGSLLDIAQPRAHQTIAGWAQRWPRYRFRLLHKDNVVLTDPQVRPAFHGARARPSDPTSSPCPTPH